MPRQYRKRTKEQQLEGLKAKKEALVKKIASLQSKIEKIGDHEQKIQNRIEKQKAKASV